MRWSTACPDWADRLKAGKSIIPAPIYPEQAQQALNIFKALRVIDLPGRPTFGECSDQWVFDFVSAVFGAYDVDTGKQLIREFYLLISKKNSKSTIAAGIMLTATILCWREDEEHLILAPTKEVADNSFKPAAGMIRADEELTTLFQVQDHIRTITHRVTHASLKVVAADTETVSGKKSGRILVDEHWMFGKRANAEAMFMEALGGQVSRKEGWVMFLSTQSDDSPAGVFKQKLDYFHQVRDGTIVDPKSLGVLYEFPPDMLKAKSYLDSANFHITNPNLGRSVDSEWLSDQIKKLQGRTDGAFQQFLAKHLNVEIGLSLRADRWAGADYWDKNSAPELTLEEVIRRSDLIAIGIDGGGMDDLLGLVVLGRDSETGDWLAWCKAWAHKIVLERRKAEAPRFRDFETAGDLVIVPDESEQDVSDVAEIASLVMASGKLDKIGVDPVGIGSILDALSDESVGIPANLILGISQGWRMSGAIKTTERKLAAGALKHSGASMMSWCVGNCKVEPKGNAVAINKQQSGSAKIDPVMALFNAVSLMSIAPVPNTIGSDYELMVA